MTDYSLFHEYPRFLLLSSLDYASAQQTHQELAKQLERIDSTFHLNQASRLWNMLAPGVFPEILNLLLFRFRMNKLSLRAFRRSTVIHVSRYIPTLTSSHIKIIKQPNNNNSVSYNKFSPNWFLEINNNSQLDLSYRLKVSTLQLVKQFLMNDPNPNVSCHLGELKYRK